MKNIKQSIKNKAKATGEFISKNKEIIIPVVTATVTITYAVLRIKSMTKSKEVEEETKQVEGNLEDVRDYMIGSKITNEENDWPIWGGFISGSNKQSSEELLEQVIEDINNNNITIQEGKWSKVS